MRRVIRCTGARVVTGTAFGVLALLSLPSFWQHSSSSYVLGALLGSVSIFFFVRGVRSGYMASDTATLTVRTLLRTSRFELNSLRSVEIHEYRQITRRVFPNLILKDGNSYKLSEFFQQARFYNADSETGIVRRAAAFVESAIDASRFADPGSEDTESRPKRNT
jgi:hypothetical protein